MNCTIQKSVQREVGEHERLALTLHCLTCGALRTFGIHINHSMLIDKRWSALKFEAECNICHTRVAATLGWHSNAPGFSFVPVSMEGDGIKVEDDIGLFLVGSDLEDGEHRSRG